MDAQEMKDYAGRVVRYFFGLELKTSEQVSLNHHVEAALDDRAKIGMLNVSVASSGV